MSSTFTVTLCTSKTAVQKRIKLDTDTNSLITEPPIPPSDFQAELLELKSFDRFATVLEDIENDQFIIHGRSKHKSVRVLSKAKKEKTKGKKIITRTKGQDGFFYPIGKPSLFMMDIDVEGYDVEDIIFMLSELFPPFEKVGYVAMPSSSSQIHTEDEDYTDTRWHIYFVAKNGGDIERFKEAIFRKAIISGKGYAFISRDGSIHVRTFFDKMVMSPERIDFVTKPRLTRPLKQDRPDIVVNEGEALDTSGMASMDSTTKTSHYNKMCRKIRKEAESKADLIKHKHIENAAKEYVKSQKVDYDTAYNIVRARYTEADEVNLHMEDIVTFEDGEEETVRVMDIISDYVKYAGRATQDPLEPEYGENKCKLFMNNGRLYINSFAHGGRKFILSGRMTTEYDTDSYYNLLGMRADPSFVHGGWRNLVKTFIQIPNAGRIDYLSPEPNVNDFRKLPEDESDVSLARETPFDTYSKQQLLEALPPMSVLTHYDDDGEPVYKKLREVFFNDIPFELRTKGYNFAPLAEDVDGRYYNLYHGYSVEPKEGSIKPFFDLIDQMEINEEEKDWFLDYIAHMYQSPFARPGTAIIIKSRQGAGKGTLMQMLGGLFPEHFVTLTNVESITGAFNESARGKLLVNLDEATFGGSHRTAATLKNLITDPEIEIRQKFKSPITLPNYMRIFITTNEEWPVHIDLDDRRYFVAEMIGVDAKKKEAFFKRLRKWYNNNGAAYLLHWALDRMVTSDLSRPPVTLAKTSLQNTSLSGIQDFIKTSLEGGTIDVIVLDERESVELNDNKPTKVSRNALYEAYIMFSKKNHPRDTTVSLRDFTSIWKSMNLGITEIGRRGDNGSRLKLVFPSLQDMTSSWEIHYGKLHSHPQLRIVRSKK